MTPVSLSVLVVLAIAAAWAMSWPHIGGWGRHAAADRRRGRTLTGISYTGVQLPKDDASSLSSMNAAWPELIRHHSSRSPLIWNYLYTGTADGASLDVLVGSDRVGEDKRVLADAFDQRLVFSRAQTPFEDQFVAMREASVQMPDSES
jgi:hypothetical protein